MEWKGLVHSPPMFPFSALFGQTIYMQGGDDWFVLNDDLGSKSFYKVPINQIPTVNFHIGKYLLLPSGLAK